MNNSQANTAMQNACLTAMPASKSFASLNADQARAAQHGADGPLLIIAGAGSGKTQTLAHRVAHLIEQGADPGSSASSPAAA